MYILSCAPMLCETMRPTRVEKSIASSGVSW